MEQSEPLLIHCLNDDNLYLKAIILPKFSKLIRDRLKFGMNYGFIIGGQVLKYNKNYKRKKRCANIINFIIIYIKFLLFLKLIQENI